MIAVIVAGLALLAALTGAAVWIVSVVRADGRERAAALVLAEKLQGETNLANTKATTVIATLADALRRQTRRADALDSFIRNDRISRHGVVDDGTDLLLAELDIVASGFDTDDADTADTPATGSRSDTGGTVLVDPATLGPAAGGEGNAARNGGVPKGEAQ